MTKKEAAEFLESFIDLIKVKSISKLVKLNNFGTFHSKKTPKRIGRNPKTLDSYIIPELVKLTFIPSNKIREYIN